MSGKANKRQLIMQAAERLFTSRRFHEITLDNVAAEAGIAKGTIYTYFNDKEDLFFQTGTSGFDELCELIRRKVPDTAPFQEQLLGVCREIGRFFEHRHQLLRMMQQEDGRFSHYKGNLRQRWMEKRKELIAAISEILVKGVQSGMVRADISPAVLASILLGMLRTQFIHLGDSPCSMRNHEVIIDLFRHGSAGPADGRTDQASSSRHGQSLPARQARSPK